MSEKDYVVIIVEGIGETKCIQIQCLRLFILIDIIGNAFLIKFIVRLQIVNTGLTTPYC